MKVREKILITLNVFGIIKNIKYLPYNLIYTTIRSGKHNFFRKETEVDDDNYLGHRGRRFRKASMPHDGKCSSNKVWHSHQKKEYIFSDF